MAQKHQLQLHKSLLRELCVLPGYNYNHMNYSLADYSHNNFVDNGVPSRFSSLVNQAGKMWGMEWWWMDSPDFRLWIWNFRAWNFRKNRLQTNKTRDFCRKCQALKRQFQGLIFRPFHTPRINALLFCPWSTTHKDFEEVVCGDSWETPVTIFASLAAIPRCQDCDMALVEAHRCHLTSCTIATKNLPAGLIVLGNEFLPGKRLPDRNLFSRNLFVL